MVAIFNKSNRPIGIAGQSVLPDKEILVKDKDVYCAVFDEDGKDTGRKMILPGLTALELQGFVTIRVVEDKAPANTSESAAVEEGEKPKKATRTRTKKTEAEAE